MLTRSKKQALLSFLKLRDIWVGKAAKMFLQRFVDNTGKLNGCTFRYLDEYLEKGIITGDKTFFGESRFFVALMDWCIAEEEIKWLRENRYRGKDLAEVILPWVICYGIDESDDEDDCICYKFIG